METITKTGPSPMGIERQRLLRMLSWEHGKPLPDLVLALLGWHFGTRKGNLIPGKSVFMVPVERVAHFLTFYCPVKSHINKTGVSMEDLQNVISIYGDRR